MATTKNKTTTKTKAPAKAKKGDKGHTQDPKLVAFSSDDQAEVKYIASRYKIPIAVVRATMAEIGKKGKPARSRFKIYAALRLKNYVIPTRYKKANHPENKKASKKSAKK